MATSKYDSRSIGRTPSEWRCTGFLNPKRITCRSPTTTADSIRACSRISIDLPRSHPAVHHELASIDKAPIDRCNEGYPGSSVVVRAHPAVEVALRHRSVGRARVGIVCQDLADPLTLDSSGTNDYGSNPRCGVIHCQGSRQTDHSCLGCAIGGAVGYSYEPRDGGDVHDDAASRAKENRELRATNDEPAGEVHGDDAIPLFLRRPQNSAGDADAGHVRDQPQPSLARECFEGGRHKLFVSHIADEAGSPSPRRLDGVKSPFHTTPAEVAHPDPVSVAREAPGGGASEARAGACYERAQQVSITAQ